LVSKSEGLLMKETTTGGKPMTLGLQSRRSRSASSARIERSGYDRERSELPGLITAGVMTFLLSGDLRLATRATRLLIADGGAAPADAQTPPRAGRRVRHRRR
jgi:hypothetical protein